MHYKTKSLITLGMIILFMVVVGVFINNLEGTITGAVTGTIAGECSEDVDCFDDNPCTQDLCIYKDSSAALCINKEIQGCSS